MWRRWLDTYRAWRLEYEAWTDPSRCDVTLNGVRCAHRKGHVGLHESDWVAKNGNPHKAAAAELWRRRANGE